MSPNDIVDGVVLKDMETTFGKLLRVRIGDKQIACDIFANFSLSCTGREIGNVVNNLRAFCDTIEGQYE